MRRIPPRPSPQSHPPPPPAPPRPPPRANRSPPRETTGARGSAPVVSRSPPRESTGGRGSARRPPPPPGAAPGEKARTPRKAAGFPKRVPRLAVQRASASSAPPIRAAAAAAPEDEVALLRPAEPRDDRAVHVRQKVADSDPPARVRRPAGHQLQHLGCVRVRVCVRACVRACVVFPQGRRAPAAAPVEGLGFRSVCVWGGGGKAPASAPVASAPVVGAGFGAKGFEAPGSGHLTISQIIP